MKALYFIEEPEKLSSVDMETLMGGTDPANDCVGHCSGSSCNGQKKAPGEGELSVC